MQVLPLEDCYEASYITGPKHVTLQLHVTIENEPDDLAIVVLPAQGSCRHSELSQPQIVAAVDEGIARANTALHTAYQRVTLRYLANDTPTYILYHLLAYHIVLFHHGLNRMTQTECSWKEVFAIETASKTIDAQWHVAGRAWSNAYLGDVLFIQNGSHVTPYEVIKLETYGHDVSELDRMMTGALTLKPVFQDVEEMPMFLYR